MCGRYSLQATASELADRFGVTVPSSFEPRYNCAPSQELPVVTDGGEFRRMEWGFTPSWAEESFDLINARAETITEKRSFADAFERRRCLVPATGFYEWTTATLDGDAGEQTDADGEKRPYHVAFDDDRVFTMAGIYERWTPPTRQSGLAEFGHGGGDEDATVETFAVVTTEPNELVSQLHHRMAVILPREAESTWLHADPDDCRDLLSPHPDESMTAVPVSTRVNDPANDDPSVLG
jgi:putative SOS response-associated peptidase YedK